MKIERIRLLRVAPGEHIAAWRRRLADASWLGSSRVLKQDGHAWVWRVRFEDVGPEFVVKCRPSSGWREAVKRFAGKTRGDRHWAGAAWLDEHGFKTARPVVLAAALVDGVGCELLVTEFVDARSVLEHLAAGDLSVREEHEVCRALARLLAGMLLKGRYNRDGKPSNLLVVRRSGGGIEIATIDTVAIRSTRANASRRTIDMLASLAIEPIGTGYEPRGALKARVVHEIERFLSRETPWDRERSKRRRLDLWADVGAAVCAHGDPRPRVDPLHP